MTWLRQWKARDVLKLLAVVLPALLLVGAGLGWIVHEYHRKADEKASDRADMASMTWVTMASLVMPMALAILALVENTLPAALPPFRSVKRKVVS